MKTISTLLATSFLSAGPIVKAAVLDNNGNPNNSIAKKAVKVGVAREVIDPNDSAAKKVVKASVIKGDNRKKRQMKRN